MTWRVYVFDPDERLRINLCFETCEAAEKFATHWRSQTYEDSDDPRKYTAAVAGESDPDPSWLLQRLLRQYAASQGKAARCLSCRGPVSRLLGGCCPSCGPCVDI